MSIVCVLYVNKTDWHELFSLDVRRRRVYSPVFFLPGVEITNEREPPCRVDSLYRIRVSVDARQTQ